MKEILKLWKQFIPLSLCDLSMACIDPMIFFALACLPNTRENIAAIGIAKAICVFFESPIIMLLQTSNTFALNPISSKTLFYFMILFCSSLSLILGGISTPFIFNSTLATYMNIPAPLVESTRQAVYLLILWPFIIGVRRYYQGILIRFSYQNIIGMAGLLRVAIAGLSLGIGVYLRINGALLASCTLLIGAFSECAIIVIFAMKLKYPKVNPVLSEADFPTTIYGTWKFYWPLANSMIILWGGRLLLLAIIARSLNAITALIVWTSAWSIILVISNSTRMVQQIFIAKKNIISERILMTFFISVGISYSLILLFLCLSSVGISFIHHLVGNDSSLALEIKKIILVCILLPFAVTFQNVFQGKLLHYHKTKIINKITWFCTVMLLIIVFILVQLKFAGQLAAAIAINFSIIMEVTLLCFIVTLYEKQK